MPEPNLPPLRLHMDQDKPNENNLVDVNRLRKSMPELPDETRERMQKQYDVPLDDINILLVRITLLNKMKHQINISEHCF